MANGIRYIAGALCGWMLAGWNAPASAEGNVQRGAALFEQCAACHSLESGRHMTGPSLAGVFGRKAGAAEGFLRYSDPLKRSGLVWNEKSLDRWLKDPQALVPGNGMAFRGVPDHRARADLVAYLKAVSEGKEAPVPRGGKGRMDQGARANLKQAAQDNLVVAIRYCGDTYRAITASSKTVTFWEFNLRFKTDTSAEGPARGKPVLLPAGMMGDRASIVFAGPEEMATFIKRQCD